MAEGRDKLSGFPPKMSLCEKPFLSGNRKFIHRKRLPWSSVEFLHKREQGNRMNVDTVCSNYYKYMSPVELWDLSIPAIGSPHGAIFNLEFTPCGSLLVAACQGQSLLLFDPITHQMIKSIKTAHADCVNCVRFLDPRTFAVCSDDTSISLWDARNPSCELLRLRGHTNWVKSIEFHRPTRQLVSSAFDDTVRVWDLNGYRDSDACGQVVLRCPKLTRMKLSPDGMQMIISAIPGTLTVIHNLNLAYLFDDFKESLYDMGRPTNCTEHLLNRKRNAFETLDDFPESCLPWCISSLEVHPFGWSVLSRFTNHRSWHEWTALHDIQCATPTEKIHGDTGSQEDSRGSLTRLTHSIEEPNTAKGYIKEQSFSNDGRVICSPFGNAARLLAFSQHCEEMSECVRSSSMELYELKTLIKHKHPVLTCRFSPTQMMLATGCLGGGVGFHQPHL